MHAMLTSFEQRFSAIHGRSMRLINDLSDADLFRRPRDIGSMAMFSTGEYILRSAGAVEQTCGGITTRLWDDPFEWTLPEKLSTSERVVEYLNEVEDTRRNAFRFFTSDSDLSKEIPSPERLRSIFDLMLETLGRAEHYQGRAFAIFQMLSDKKLPRL